MTVSGTKGAVNGPHLLGRPAALIRREWDRMAGGVSALYFAATGLF